ncbi:MAG: heparinase II/III family protein [Acidobacteria bacterium]|nr:heparinase II/III family protein [Acidobacteriota bacterium]
MRTAAILALTFAVSAAGEVSALHPRIYVRADGARVGQGLTVSQFRARWKNPAYARFRVPVSARGAAGAAELAARYLEEGRAGDLAAVRDFLASHTYSYEKNDVGGFLAAAEMAIAFDWVHAGLAPAERAAAMANIAATADSSRRFLLRGQPDINHNYTYMALNAVAVCGLVLKGEPAPYDGKAAEYLELARRFIEPPGMVLDTWNARESAWGEGSHYTFHETLRTLVLTLHAYRSATGGDYFPRIRARHGDFIRKAGRFLIACTRPDMTFERTGDTSANRVQASLTVPLTVEMLAAGVEDARESARLHSFAQALLAAYGDQAVRPEFGWGMRIFFDPREPVTPSYRTLPLFQRLGAGTYDQFLWRSGWGADSTMITILAGDHYTDHQHFDKGQFLIYRRGGLAVDSGAYDGMYRPDRHANEYAPRTLAHNCLLVYDPQQALPKGYTNDGGQSIIRGKQHHANWPMYLSHARAEGLDTAQVLASDQDEKNGYAYLQVDLSRAYGGRVAHYDRQFAYLPAADFLLVLNTVTSARPEVQKRWLLHFQDEPLVDGEAPGGGIRAFPGAQLTTVRRQGTLFVRTLLPAQHTVTTVGGPGYEFFNAFTGKNYPVSNPNVAAEAREAGRWRIEVAPAQPAASDRFLHAIEIREGASARATDARLVLDSAGNAAGAHLLTAGRNRVVLFTSGALPLRYQLSGEAAAQHLVTGLKPRQGVVVRVNDKTVLRTRANLNGVVRFEDRVSGARTVAIESR